jgi:hypothetical protein
MQLAVTVNSSRLRIVWAPGAAPPPAGAGSVPVAGVKSMRLAPFSAVPALAAVSALAAWLAFVAAAAVRALVACVAVLALSALFALGTLPSLLSLICLPVSVWFLSRLPDSELRLISLSPPTRWLAATAVPDAAMTSATSEITSDADGRRLDFCNIPQPPLLFWNVETVKR